MWDTCILICRKSGYFTKFWGGVSSTQWKIWPNQIEGFVKMRDQKDLRTIKMTINKIQNQVEIWYKIIQTVKWQILVKNWANFRPNYLCFVTKSDRDKLIFLRKGGINGIALKHKMRTQQDRKMSKPGSNHLQVWKCWPPLRTVQICLCIVVMVCTILLLDKYYLQGEEDISPSLLYEKNPECVLLPQRAIFNF